MEEMFNNSILKIVERFSYNFFIVQQDFGINCTCVNFDTKQADPACPKCLGTGKKITIRKIRGASADSGIPQTIRTQGDFLIAKTYYIPCSTPIADNNIIVDDGAWPVYKTQNLRSFGGGNIYQKCLTVSKKSNEHLFLDNFYKIVGRYKP